MNNLGRYYFEHVVLDDQNKFVVVKDTELLLERSERHIIGNIKSKVLTELGLDEKDHALYWIVVFHEDLVCKGNYRRVDSDDDSDEFDETGLIWWNMYVIKPDDLDKIPDMDPEDVCGTYPARCNCDRCSWLEGNPDL